MNAVPGSKAVLELKLYNYISNNNSIKFMSLVDDYIFNRLPKRNPLPLGGG